MIQYLIKNGDSLEQIALSNLLDIRDLLLANPELELGYYPGMTIKIPEFGAMASNIHSDLAFIKDGQLSPGNNALSEIVVIGNYNKPLYKKGWDILKKYTGDAVLKFGRYVNDEVLLNKNNSRVRLYLNPRFDLVLANVRWGNDVAGYFGLAALGMAYNPFVVFGSLTGGSVSDAIINATTPYGGYTELAENKYGFHPMVARYTNPGAIMGGMFLGGLSTAGPGGLRGFMRGFRQNLRAAAKNPEIEAANMDRINALPVFDRESATMAYARGLRNYRGAGVSSKTKGSNGDIYHTTYKSPTADEVSGNVSSGHSVSNFGRHVATTGYQVAPSSGTRISFIPSVPYTPISISPGYFPYITTTPWHPPVVYPNTVPEEHLEQTMHMYGPNWEEAYSKLPNGAILEWPGDEYSPAGRWVVDRSGNDMYRTSDANITTTVNGRNAGYEIQPSVKVYPVDSALGGITVTRLPRKYTPEGPTNGRIIVEQ